MKILFVSHSTSRTGAPLLLRDIASLILEPGDEFHFVIPDHGSLEPDFLTLGSVVVDPLYPDELPYWREARRLIGRIQLLNRIRPDVLYCNTIHSAKWLVYARLGRIPTITHIHELAGGFAELSFPEHLLVRKLSRRIIAVSDAVRSYLVGEQRFDPENITVVRAGIRVDRFTESPAGELKTSLGLGRSLVIGTVGRITHVKGSDLFLDLAMKIRTMFTPEQGLKFLVICSAEDREAYSRFREGLETSGLVKDVVILENIPDVARYYSLMDVYVSTAREDPFPLVILEAMASRVPVIAFSTGGIPEALEKSSGELVAPFDIPAMAESVVRLLKDSARRSEIGANGRTRVERHFDLRQNAREIRRIIDSVVR